MATATTTSPRRERRERATRAPLPWTLRSSPSPVAIPPFLHKSPRSPRDSHAEWHTHARTPIIQDKPHRLGDGGHHGGGSGGDGIEDSRRAVRATSVRGGRHPLLALRLPVLHQLSQPPPGHPLRPLLRALRAGPVRREAAEEDGARAQV